MTRSLDQALLQGADVSAMASMNLLVNGFHQISQENADNAVVGTGVSTVPYLTDQWQHTRSASAGTTSARLAAPFPSQPDIAYGLRIVTSTVQTTISANDFMMVAQPIEGINLARLKFGAANAKPVTVAFLIRPNFTGVAGFSLYNIGAARSLMHRLPLIANQDNFFCFTIPGDVAGALIGTNAQSLQFRLCFGSGSNFQGTNFDTWSGANLLGPPDITNMAGVLGNAVIFSGAVMLPGRFTITPDMLSLLARPNDDELRKCQRYWQTNPYCQGAIPNQNATLLKCQAMFSVPMRTAPSPTVFGSSLTIDMPYFAAVAATLNANQCTPQWFSVIVNCGSQTAGYQANLSPNSIACNARM